MKKILVGLLVGLVFNSFGYELTLQTKETSSYYSNPVTKEKTLADYNRSIQDIYINTEEKIITLPYPSRDDDVKLNIINFLDKVDDEGLPYVMFNVLDDNGSKGMVVLKKGAVLLYFGNFIIVYKVYPNEVK